LRGGRCVVNEPLSHSGLNSLRAAVAPLARSGRFFAAVVQSGGHRASLERIANDTADVAAIDCVSYALLAKHRPELVETTRTLFLTESVPAPPLVTRSGIEPGTLRAVRRALTELVANQDAAPHRLALHLDGFEEMGPAAYEVMFEQSRRATALGYLELDLPAGFPRSPSTNGNGPGGCH
jgi:ABC-type phosphate/phosphonate transport system substrate-binding protein